MNKISNECFKCRSRFCSTGIISVADAGERFNEIACPKHTSELYRRADEVLGRKNGVERLHISTTGTLSRRILKDKLLELEAR
ncbi:hypothetical protein [Jeotgalibaca porci]|uniref:hypothetical protein n=1 Tax=Jeotgalibaca porci TaxID=1868793 RepID=UPI0035A05311